MAEGRTRRFNGWAKVFASGNLTRDAELFVMQKRDGTDLPVLKFTIACPTKGGWAVSYINCALFGGRATAVKDFLRKGMHLECLGDWVQDKKVGEDGKAIYYHTLQVDSLILPPKGQAAEYTSDADIDFSGGDDDESDIPW